jgi:hypothetical protein
MFRKAFVVRPQLGEADKPKVKWIFRDVISDAPVVSVSRFDKRSQVRPNLRQPLGRKPENSEHGYLWLHS